MPAISYNSAKHTLHSVLQGSAFHQSVRLHPWWYPVLQWLRRHVHLSIHFGQLKPVAWVITIAIAVVFVAAVVVWLTYRWRRRSWKLVEKNLVTDKRSTLEQKIEQSIQSADWDAALHLLMTAAVSYAHTRHWLRDTPYKTARRCLRELRGSADPGFTALFSELAVTVEQVVFARKKAESHRILQLWEELQKWREKVSA